MLLKTLDDSIPKMKVCLYETASNKLSMFIEDKIKRELGSIMDTIIDLTNKKDIKKVKDIQTLDPPQSKKWLVKVNLEKFGVNNELKTLIADSTTCLFLCTSEKYSTYKKFKDLLKKENGVYDYYLPYLKRPDLVYLYSAFVPTKNQLTKQLFDYVAQSYSSDAEAIINLFLEIASGTKIANRSDIAKICGIGGNSIEGLVFAFLKPPPVTEKGVKTVIRNRVKAGLDLANVYEYKTFYNLFNSILQSILDIKVLYMSGIIYKQIIELPEPYDVKKLARYQKYLWKIKQIPTSRVLRCKSILNTCGRWGSDADFMRFVYCFMLDMQHYEVLPFIDILKVDDKIEKDISTLEDEESIYDFDELNRRMSLDYTDKSAKALYAELVKRGLMPEIKDSERKYGVVEAEKKNFSPAETMFENMNDDASLMDVAIAIASHNQ